MEKNRYVSSTLWLILSCLHLHSPALNVFCSLNNRCKTQWCRCCMYLPASSEETSHMAPATEPWLLPRTVLFRVFLSERLSDSISRASGRTTAHEHPEHSACCRMLPHQASRASERWGKTWRFRSLLKVPLATKGYAQHLVPLLSLLNRDKDRACNSTDHQKAFSFNSSTLFNSEFQC